MREGLEAALIIGIVLGALLKLNRAELSKTVWLGAGLAAAISAAAAIGLNLIGMEFKGRGEQIFEGIAMLSAAGVLTWMILWMHNSAVNLKSEIEAKTQNAVRGKGGNALFALAFLAVFREGIELSLFLLAAQEASSPAQTLIGALTGLAGAAVLGWMLFRSTRKLSLRNFFQITNILLIIFAAGLVAYGVHEFNEAGIIPSVIEHVWDINGFVNETSELGLVLKALFGYNANPSLTEVLAYMLYLGGIIAYVASRKQNIPAMASGAAN
jgi:high-affinity iron transporter